MQYRRSVSALVRRLAHFWVVWSALLLVHEGGHALGAWTQGAQARRVTVGVGPVVWRGTVARTEAVLRLVPIAGITTLRASSTAKPNVAGWSAWRRHAIVLLAGIGATLLLGVAVAGVVAAGERTTKHRWTWGRFIVADAVVLTVLNFLPVPPLDGGRALIEGIVAWRGTPLSSDTLFWVQAIGLALAAIPMTLWTRWTARIDALALHWKAPRSPAVPAPLPPIDEGRTPKAA